MPAGCYNGRMDKQSVANKAIRTVTSMAARKYGPYVRDALNQADFTERILNYAARKRGFWKTIADDIRHPNAVGVKPFFPELSATIDKHNARAVDLSGKQQAMVDRVKRLVPRDQTVKFLGPKLFPATPKPGMRAWEINYQPVEMYRSREWMNTPKYLRNAYEAGHTVVPPNARQFRSIAPGRNI